MPTPTPAALIFENVYDPDGTVIATRLVNRRPPSLSSISTDLLDELDPRFRDPATPDVLTFRGDARYLVGDLTPDGHCRYLHRLP